MKLRFVSVLLILVLVAKHKTQSTDTINPYDGNISMEHVNPHIIDFPTKCPEGYRKDKYGVCREIFD